MITFCSNCGQRKGMTRRDIQTGDTLIKLEKENKRSHNFSVQSIKK